MRVNITDSYWAIILPGIFNPFGVFVLRQSIKMIPCSYIKSVKIDGAGHIQIFLHIVMPIIKSGLMAAAMLILIDYWNMVDQAVIFIRESTKQPLSMFLANINQEKMGVSFAGACFYAIPVLIMLIYGQEYLKEGIGLSGIKG